VTISRHGNKLSFDLHGRYNTRVNAGVTGVIFAIIARRNSRGPARDISVARSAARKRVAVGNEAARVDLATACDDR